MSAVRSAPCKTWRASQSIRVAVVLERYGNVMSPCSSIRLHAFTERFPADVRYLLVEEVNAFKPDVILWNRGALPSVETVDALAAIAGELGSRLVYDLDDNLLAMDEHPERESYLGLVAAVRRSLQVADEVWCSTRVLADAVAREGGTSVLMPNVLDPELWERTELPQPPAADSQALRLVYMGTRTHDEDYRLLEAALLELERQRPGSFSLTLIGVNAQHAVVYPWMQPAAPPAHTGASYPAFVRWFVCQGPFDLGLAPLMDSTFNRAKSSIKVLDYAAIGVPTLASAVAGYQEDDAGDRLLVENTVEAWAQVLVDAVDGRLDLPGLSAAVAARVGPARFEQGVACRWERCMPPVLPGA